MIGIQVRCACYSKLLSKRDEKDFEQLFIQFNVKHLIVYSTIDELAEECINEKGDVRDLALHHVSRSSGSAQPSSRQDASFSQSVLQAPSTKRVLLIDEVDVFFSSSFMGQSFNPIAKLGCENTTILMKHIWHNRAQLTHQVFSSTRQLPQYTALKENTFSDAAAEIVDRELINMIKDAQTFDDPAYKVFNEAPPDHEAQVRVGYERFDGMTTKIEYGYKTAFAWLHEAEKQIVPLLLAEERLKFQIPCGRFSYASIPMNHFDCVLGVTGTLSCLTANERRLIQEDYSIGPDQMTFLPSLYPANEQPRTTDNFTVYRDVQTWQQTIARRINQEAVKGRPVLVFFESEECIKTFLSSEYGGQILSHQLIVESTPDVPDRVAKATAPSQVTLISRVFGRGLDFKVHHPSIEDCGGVYVLCTFYPQSAGEEIQIMGRTARQGKRGTYGLIVYEKDLQRDFSAPPTLFEGLKDNPKAVQESVLAFLKKQRTTQTDQLLDGKKEKVLRCAPDHDKSMELVHLCSQDHPPSDAIIQIILSFCRLQGSKGPLHIIFCLDCSGSMAESWPSVILAASAFIEIRQQLCCIDDCFSCVQFSDEIFPIFSRLRIDAAIQECTKEKLLMHGGGTYFSPALKAVSQLVGKGEEVAIVFMTDGANDPEDADPTLEIPSIMSKCAKVHFFGVAFTALGKTPLFQTIVQTFQGDLLEAAGVSELRAKFQEIANNPTASHSR